MRACERADARSLLQIGQFADGFIGSARRAALEGMVISIPSMALTVVEVPSCGIAVGTTPVSRPLCSD